VGGSRFGFERKSERQAPTKGIGGGDGGGEEGNRQKKITTLSSRRTQRRGSLFCRGEIVGKGKETRKQRGGQFNTKEKRKKTAPPAASAPQVHSLPPNFDYREKRGGCEPKKKQEKEKLGGLFCGWEDQRCFSLLDERPTRAIPRRGSDEKRKEGVMTPHLKKKKQEETRLTEANQKR